MIKIHKKISIFGSTGSIGSNSLEVIDNLSKNGYDIDVVYLTTNSRIDLLAAQIKKYSPRGILILDKKAFSDFNLNYNFKELEILSGCEGLLELSRRTDYDLLINALVGFSGLMPTVEALKSGKDVAIANKESLVVAGKIINELTSKNGTNLFPIDSEHSAILQCLIGEKKQSVSRVILTASGGPLYNKSAEEIKNTSVENALAHPNWKMGQKITIDSATMMNKGLEIIEAKWLFDLNTNQIDVLVHPQSIIHSMVEFIDGSLKAQLGMPDMKIPIQYSLTYPDRVFSNYSTIDFKKLKPLTFEEPDLDKFKCLRIAYDVLKEGGTFPVVMNAANEVAVDLFLKRKINFHEISEIIETQLNKHTNKQEYNLADIVQIDTITRNNILNEPINTYK